MNEPVNISGRQLLLLEARSVPSIITLHSSQVQNVQFRSRWTLERCWPAQQPCHIASLTIGSLLN